MHKVLTTILVITLLGGILGACANSPAPPATTPKQNAAPLVKTGWEQQWETSLAEGKKEGSVAVYSIWSPDVRNALAQTFKQKYGINLEFSSFSRGADLLAKVQAEKRAGLYLADIFGVGNLSLITSMKPEGVLSPIGPVLLLPDVLDPKAWRAGKLPYTDPDGLALSAIGSVMRTLVYNTDSIKPGELTDWKDLLKPQYKGKITLNDPTVTGTGNALVTNVAVNMWGEDETAAFLTRLTKDQQTVVQRDYRIHMESVARGKYAIGMMPMQQLVAEFTGLGAPIKIATVNEDTHVSAGAGAIGVPTQFAHPNAARVFLNWFLSKEGQSVLVKAWGNPSTRADVPAEGIDPLFVPEPGGKYFLETGPFLDATARWRDIANKIIQESSK